MDQRDSYCPYSLSSEITAKPTVLGYVLMCYIHCVTCLSALTRHNIQFLLYYYDFTRATAGQEDPFELDSNLLLSSGRHGEDCKRQYDIFTMTYRP